ncbi:MAG TPA: hypothetical protein VMD55_04370 [Terracidiphilus sp.]|nr:hypothetical protein [Terracidiphilus sp.]
MVDYAKLAEKAKALQDAAKGPNGRLEAQEQDPTAFFGKVKSHLVAEMYKANLELGKRGLSTLDRSFSPSFSGRFCFTFGVSLLCGVELDTRLGQRCIKATVSGPPNAREIGRRVYLFNRASQQPQSFMEDETAGVIVRGLGPEEIAVDIISSVLSGEFS